MDIHRPRAILTAIAAIAAATPGVSTAGDACTSGWFPNASFRSIDRTEDAATDDLDGSGRPDILVLNLDGGLQVFMDQGAIGYVPAVVYDMGTNRRELLVGDLDGDGRTDVAATSQFFDDLVIRRGGGDGAFITPFVDDLGRPSTTATLGDVNGDGNLDIVSTELAEDRVSVFLGQGDFSFDAPMTITMAAGAAPYGVTLANVIGSPALDLLVTRYNDALIEVRPGLGNGSFTGATTYAVGIRPRRILASDLTGDGLLDLAVPGLESDDVSVLVNLGSSFAPAVSYAVSLEPSLVRAADLDGDGDRDLVVAHEGPFYDLAILSNDGEGVFAAPALLAPGHDVAGLVLDDLDGNTSIDIVQANTVNSFDRGTVLTLLNPGDASFPVPVDLYTTPDQPLDLDLADLNGDAILDVVSVTLPGRVRTRFGRPDGSFGPQGTVGNFFNGGWSVITPDLDGDGDRDLAFVSAFLYTRFNNGSGIFAAGQMLDVGTGLIEVQAGDLDGDGDVDLIARNNTPPEIVRLLNDGAGFVTPADTALDDLATGMTLLDADDDLDLDVAVGTNARELLILTNDGAGGLTPGAPIDAAGSPSALEAGDLNGDGRADLVFAYDWNTADVHGMTAWLNDGDGGFVESWDRPMETDLKDMELVDFDGDGDLDIVAAVGEFWASLNTASIFLGDGAGGFVEGPMVQLIEGQPTAIEVGDITGDGDLDIVTTQLGDFILVATNVCARPCPANISGVDDTVDMLDILLLLAAWGPCETGPCPADLDGNREVGWNDLMILLASWGPC